MSIIKNYTLAGGVSQVNAGYTTQTAYIRIPPNTANFKINKLFLQYNISDSAGKPKPIELCVDADFNLKVSCANIGGTNILGYIMEGLTVPGSMFTANAIWMFRNEQLFFTNLEGSGDIRLDMQIGNYLATTIIANYFVHIEVEALY
jgi:hypothetical protein